MDRPPSASSPPSESPGPGGGPEVIGVDSEEADAVISALSSDTARAVLEHLHEQPDTHSGLADRLDTTIQTVEYHLSNLEDAGLVAADGVITADTGQEMTVYAPSDRPLVVVAGDEADDEGLRAVLKRTLGGVGVLALASVLVDRLLRAPGTPSEPVAAPTSTPEPTATPGEDADGAAEATATPTPVEDAAGASPTGTAAPTAESTGTPPPTPEPTPTEVGTGTPAASPTPTEAPEAAQTPAPTGTPQPTGVPESGPELFDATLSTLPPGVVFFLGGLLGILLVVALTHRRRLS